MIQINDLYYYPVIEEHALNYKETYTFITGDQDNPQTRVLQVTFYKDVRSVKFEDVTHLHTRTAKP